MHVFLRRIQTLTSFSISIFNTEIFPCHFGSNFGFVFFPYEIPNLAESRAGTAGTTGAPVLQWQEG
jgi:hypothetical protein